MHPRARFQSNKRMMLQRVRCQSRPWRSVNLLLCVSPDCAGMKLPAPLCELLTFALFCITAIGAHAEQEQAKPLAKQPFTFIQICDPQLGKGGYEHDLKTFEQAVVQSNALKPDFVVICGDLVSRLNEQSAKDINRIKAGFTMPAHCVPGNHDVFWGPQDKRNNITQPQSLANYRKAFGKDYYSFEHRGHVFLCANSMLWRTEVELEEEIQRHHQWVKDTLAAASKKGQPVFVVMHHSLYVKEPNEKDSGVNLPLEKRKELLALFERSTAWWRC